MTVSNDKKNQIAGQMQQLQQQAQAVLTQKAQIEGLLRETTSAISELDKRADNSSVYKILAGIAIKSDKAAIKGELLEQKDLLEARLAILIKQENRIRDHFTELHEQLKLFTEAPEYLEASNPGLNE